MEKIKSWIRIFFGFSRTETNGFLILLPLMAVILFSEPLYRWYRTTQPQDFSKDAMSLDSLIAQLNWNSRDTILIQEKATVTIHLTAFDPNKATQKELSALGLKDFLIRRIVRYREKGGVFRKKADVLKIYGMDSSWYNQVQGSMIFPQKKEPISKTPSTRKRSDEPMDINEADSLQLLKIYGIGPALSKRIRTFRDRLGGFVSLEQLHEVYGLDSAVVRQLKKKFVVREGFIPRQIPLNTATLEGLLHPYIKRREAQAILSYRLQHGEFTSIEQLAEINLLTHAWIAHVMPYLTLKK